MTANVLSTPGLRPRSHTQRGGYLVHCIVTFDARCRLYCQLHAALPGPKVTECRFDWYDCLRAIAAAEEACDVMVDADHLKWLALDGDLFADRVRLAEQSFAISSLTRTTLAPDEFSAAVKLRPG